MPPTLPDDLWELILRHRAAMRLQRCLRARQLSYARTASWTTLRRLLAPRLELEDWAPLLSNVWVRREWCQEPESWIYMLRYEEENVRAIVAECGGSSVRGSVARA